MLKANVEESMKICKQQEIVEDAKLQKLAVTKQGIKKWILNSACTLESLEALRIYQNLCLPDQLNQNF